VTAGSFPPGFFRGRLLAENEKGSIAMNRKSKKLLTAGLLELLLFALLTWLLGTVDVSIAGETETALGFAALNSGFHRLTGVHYGLYVLTDWLGLVPVGVCLVFALMGLAQLLRRKCLRKVDRDLLLLGVYYAAVIGCYLSFEKLAVNFRPVLIEGRREASYPSSTALLALSVMPSLAFQAGRRWKGGVAKWVRIGAWVFALGMVLGRLLSGVHWLTDILGAALLSEGLFKLYKAAVFCCREENCGEGPVWNSEKNCSSCGKAED